MRGLQPERTRLAWRRTSLAMLALVAIASTRVINAGTRPMAIAATSVIALLWLATLWLAHRRIRILADSESLDVRPEFSPGPAPAVLALLTAALALFGVLLVV